MRCFLRQSSSQRVYVTDSRVATRDNTTELEVELNRFAVGCVVSLGLGLDLSMMRAAAVPSCLILSTSFHRILLTTLTQGRSI